MQTINVRVNDVASIDRLYTNFYYVMAYETRVSLGSLNSHMPDLPAPTCLP